MTAPILCRARCGRTLSDPESIAKGYGPVCWGRLPAEAQAAIAETLPPKPPAKPRGPRSRSHRLESRTEAQLTAAGQLELTTDPTTERPCWACRGTGVRHTPDPADTEFEAEDPCTICEGSGLADSAGGPIVREPWTEETNA